MGINVRVSDIPTELTARVTAAREARDTEMRNRVRSGEMTLDFYLIKFRGYKFEHLNAVRDSFHAAIFGAAKRA